MSKSANDEDWPVFELWKKYEDMAMHFNDLIIKLRTQALAAVAALATIVGVFAKADTDAHTRWEMVAFAFFILLIFWIAIWVIDFRYYNRLLIGAVSALIELEKQSKDKLRVRHIDISTRIEAAVAGKLGLEGTNLSLGRWAFYGLVTFALIVGFVFSLCHVISWETLMRLAPSVDLSMTTPVVAWQSWDNLK